MEAAFVADVFDVFTGSEECLRHGNAASGHVFVDGHASGGLKQTADVGLAQIKLPGKRLNGDRTAKVGIEIFEDLRDLLIILKAGFEFGGILLLSFGMQTIQHNHQFHKSGLLDDVLSEAVVRCDLMNIEQKAFLLLL